MEVATQVAAPTNFMFGTNEVRTVYRGEDEFFFVASDVARILGYDDANRMIRMLDDDEVVFESITTKGSNRHGEFEREVEAALITEPGLYQCIFNSKLDEAVAFRKWVTKEVLPQIRKHGTYTLGQEVQSLRLQLADKDALLAKKDAEIAHKEYAVNFYTRKCVAQRDVLGAPDFKNKAVLDLYVEAELADTREAFRGYMRRIIGSTMLLRAEIDKFPMPRSKNARWEFNGLLDALNEHPLKPRQFTHDDYI